VTAEHFLTCQCVLGEGPLWFEGRLYWFDIFTGRLHCCDETGAAYRSWTFEEPFSAAAAAGEGTLLLASASGLWRFDTGSGCLCFLAMVESDQPGTRSNDGRADRHGGFWIGTMGRQAQAGAGALYRYYRGEVVKLLGGLTIPNSLCFSADGRTAYFTDSPTARILSWALDGEGWPIGRPRLFVDLTETGGSPDGSIVDRENGLWNAQWGASRLVRYRQDGSIDRAIQLPVSQPSCPAFGGMGLDTLFVTTAREGMDSERLGAEPQAGDLFRIQLNRPGMPDGSVVLYQ
jgi:sugar lactone lactonase YvrE